MADFVSEPTTPARVTTGIVGLDAVLHGGLPVNHLYLVQGKPGTGKTTLGLQFLMEGARQGEHVLYITLSETEVELHQVARSHGWSLKGINVKEFSPAEAAEQLVSTQTLFDSADVELSETTREIFEALDQVRPTRIVFDSLAEIRTLSQYSFQYRRQILTLKQYLADLRCTALLLDTADELHSDEGMQDLVHGVINLEANTPEYGDVSRRLRVAKMRGASYHEGYHDFQLFTGGIEVYRRIKLTEGSTREKWETVNSTCEPLDALLGGGLERGTSCIIIGPSGTGKTLLTTLYAYAMAKRNERVAVFMFEERIDTFLRRSNGIGLKVGSLIEQDLITLHQINTGEVSPGEFAYRVQREIEQGARAVVIDSLSGYVNAMPDQRLLYVQMHELLAYMSQKGVLSLLVATQHGIIGGDIKDPVDLSYLADTVVLLRHFEAQGAVRKALSVIKKRHGAHEKTIREMTITSSGIEVGEPITDFSGVLTAAPMFTGHRRALTSFEDGETNATQA